MTDAMSESAAYGDEKRRAVEGDGFKTAPERPRVHLMNDRGGAACGEEKGEEDEGLERTTKLGRVTCPFCLERAPKTGREDPRSGDDRRAPSVTTHLSKTSPLGVLLSACGLMSPLAAGHLFGRTIDGVDEVTCEDCKNASYVPAANKPDMVNSPAHYGGKDNPYEAIKVIRAWGYDKNFCIGSVLKYLARSGKKQGEPPLRDLEKAAWYLRDEIKAIKDREAPK